MTLQITCIRINHDTWPEIYMILIYILYLKMFIFIYLKLFLTFNLQQCSHSKFKLGVFIPPHFEIWGYEVKFEGMTFWDDIKLSLGHAWKDERNRKQNFLTGQIYCVL